MRLRQFLQTWQARADLGADPKAGTPPTAKIRQELAQDIARVQKTNEIYFATYWAVLLLSFAITFGLAVIYRNEMGGLATVLGAGGVVQSGLLLRLSTEWKEKARLDIVAVLVTSLPTSELKLILPMLMQGAAPSGPSPARTLRKASPTASP